jgi:hypothetical protein
METFICPGSRGWEVVICSNSSGVEESVVPLDQRPTICNAVDGGFLCVPRGIDQILFLPPRSENRTNTESVSPYGEKRGEIETQFDLTGTHHRETKEIKG